MATMEDFDELATAMPDTVKQTGVDGRVGYRVGQRVFCCHREPRRDAVDETTGERLDDVLMIRTESVGAKEMLLEEPGTPFFTTPHFNGYPAILVRIAELHRLDRDDLEDVVSDAWLACAPKSAAGAWLAEHNRDG